MKKLLAMLLFVSCSAFAGFSGEPAPGVTLRLEDTPCVNETIRSYIKPGYKDTLSSGAATLRGAPLEVCWVYMDGELFIIDENGRYGTVDRTKMKKDLDI